MIRLVLVAVLMLSLGMIVGSLASARIEETDSHSDSRHLNSSSKVAPESTLAATPKLVLVQAEYDFGEVDRGQVVEHNFVLKNVGTSPLEVQNVAPACRCTVAQLSQRVIEPNAELLIHAELNLHGLSGPQRKTIQVTTNDPEQPHVNLVLFGKATSLVMIEPGEINFGRLDPSDSFERVVDVKVSDKAEIEVIRAEVSGRVVSSKAETVEGGRFYRVTISLNPPLAVGFFQDVVTLTTNSNGEYRRLQIPVAGTVMPVGSVTRTPMKTTVTDLTANP